MSDPVGQCYHAAPTNQAGDHGLTPLSKLRITVIVLGAVGFVLYKKTTLFDGIAGRKGEDGESPPVAGGGSAPAGSPGGGGKRTYKVALSEWPGHMALVVGNGGLSTQ